MTKNIRNILIVLGIIIYCIVSIGYTSIPFVRYVALIVLGVHVICISIIYCIFNKPLNKKELIGEVICNIIILIIVIFVLFEYVI